MSPEQFDAALRGLHGIGSRRAALGALLGAAAAALPGGESEARRISGGRNRLQKRKKQDKDKQGKNRKQKNKDKKKGGKGSGGDSCHYNTSEKEVLSLISKAAKKYGQSASAMERVARCESVLDPCAFSKAGPYYGLFQFLKSTWKETPYGDRNIYDPEAQSLATAWMWKEGRKNEWACK